MSKLEWADRDAPASSGMKIEFALLLALHITIVLIALAGVVRPASAHAHPGGLAADGCHNDRSNGGRHCHRASQAERASLPQRAADSSVYYRNCSAARAAGAAPVRRGDPGYAPHLDRDNDGIGCE